MTKRRRERESDSSMSSTAEYNTVFVDTSLDTHLAMLVSDSDTVLDFKRKLTQEHANCFPKIGEILIHSLKVMRKGNFYHLPDFMLVCSALHGVKENWFLSADASGSSECYVNQKSSECGRKSHCGVMSSDANKVLALTMSSPDGVTEENVVSGMTVGQKVEKYSDRTAEFWMNGSLENSLGTRSPAKKKRKMKYCEAVLPSPTLKDHHTKFHASGEETLQPILSGGEIDAGEETPKIVPGFREETAREETAKDAVLRYELSNMECSGVLEGASIPATVKKCNFGSLETSANFYVLDNRKENTMLKSVMPETLMIEKPQTELVQNAPTAHLVGNTDTDAFKQNTSKKRKKKQLPNVQVIETKRTISILPTAEADLHAGGKEERNLLMNHEIGMIQPEAGVAIIEPKLPSGLIHASGASEDANYNYDKRKKKKNKNKNKKSAAKIQGTSDRENEDQKATGDDGLHHDFELMLPSPSKASGCTAMDNLDLEPANNGTSGSSAVLLCTPSDHFPEGTDKGENHMKMLDGSAADSERKVGGVAKNELDSMTSTPTVEDVGICENMMEKKNHSSAGDCLTVPPVIGKEKQVNNLEPSQVQNSSETARTKDKKAKKKTKGQLIALDCLESIPMKYQEIGVEVHSTAEKANSFFDFEQECRHVDSQVLSHKSEEKLEEIRRTAAYTDDLVRHVEDKYEGINFKNYSLPGQKQEKVASANNVKEATKSSEEMKTVKKVTKHGLPSVSTSTEVNNSVKLSENKDGKDKSSMMCSTGRKDGDLLVSSTVSDNGLINSSPTEMPGMTAREKQNENTFASPFRKDKYTHLDKSCKERSGIFSGNGGNKRRQSGRNVSEKIVVKTPEKNSLFAKVGSLFRDSSGESSGDENRTANSDASTCSPSDSSQSGCSAGSNDAQERSTCKKNNAKLDSLSAPNELTLDMILRSSKLFKKAKLIASQNELEQIDSQLESVRDSRPNQ